MKLPQSIKEFVGTDPEKSFVRKHPGLVLYLLITLLITALSLEQMPALENVENSIQDAMFSFRGDQAAGEEIVLLNIDDKSVDYLGNWPWSNHTLAQMIEALEYYQPLAVYLNFQLENQVEDYVSGNSRLLAENIMQSGNIILPYDVMPARRTPRSNSAPRQLSDVALRTKNVIGSDQVILAGRIEMPEKMFSTSAAYLGAKVNYFDQDNLVRRQPLIVKYENNIYPSSELVLAAYYLRDRPENIIYNPSHSIVIGDKEIPVDHSGRLRINYLGESGVFPNYSIRDLWEGQIPVDKLAGKLVVVDLAVTGQYDMLRTPVSKEYTSGQKLATVVQNIIKGNVIHTLSSSATLEILLILGIGLFCAVIIPRVTLMYRFIILMVSLFVIININFLLFSTFDIISKSFYAMLEIAFFMAVAPLMKSKEKKPKPLRLKNYDVSREAGQIDEMISSASKHTEKKSGDEPFKKRANQSRPITGSQPVENSQKQDNERPAKTERLESGNLDEQFVDTVELSDEDHSVIDADQPLVAGSEESSDELAFESQPLKLEEPEPNASAPSNDSSSEIKISFDESGRPKEFGRYKIIDVLGQGAMGTVYKGMDPAIGRPVALKTIRFDKLANPDEIDELRQRFMLEAKAAGNFSHPNIVTIYDVGQDKNIQYIAMEYLEGRTLEQVIERKTNFNFKIAAKVIMQICGALEYAHERHVVHRDIKPANIMVLENFYIKVMDFGIAHLESSNMTQTGIAMGTPNYISPEQLNGKDVTKSSDIFSLGVMMYEMLTGEKPFTGENISSLIVKILNHQPPPPSQIDDKVPPLLDHVVAKALEKDPLSRYHSAREMANALSDFVESFSSSHKAVKY